VFKFITRQHFLVNLLVAFALLFGLIFGFLSILDVITRHNQYEKVPDVSGKSLEEAFNILQNQGFKVEIQDSSWNAALPPLNVIKQSPKGAEMVKAHRLIFLTVNRSQPPFVEMPDLVGFSFRNAILYINQLGLELGDTSRRPDIARDAVLEQTYNGRAIPAGTRIFFGSKISFVLGSGLGNNEYDVPDLVGLTYEEGKALLRSMGLNLGGIYTDPDVKDSANAFIYRQNPNISSPMMEGRKQINRIREGQSLDLWLSRDRREKLEITEEDMIPEG
jgi:beta-lactam-binding protein with PASTA domain